MTQVQRETVTIPRVHDGIGDALRSCFAPGAADLPDDMRALLDRLN